MKRIIFIAFLACIAGCTDYDNPYKPSDEGTWRGVYKTPPDSDGIVCYKWINSTGYPGGFSCVKAK